MTTQERGRWLDILSIDEMEDHLATENPRNFITPDQVEDESALVALNDYTDEIEVSFMDRVDWEDYDYPMSDQDEEWLAAVNTPVRDSRGRRIYACPGVKRERVKVRNMPRRTMRKRKDVPAIERRTLKRYRYRDIAMAVCFVRTGNPEYMERMIRSVRRPRHFKRMLDRTLGDILRTETVNDHTREFISQVSTQAAVMTYRK